MSIGVIGVGRLYVSFVLHMQVLNVFMTAPVKIAWNVDGSGMCWGGLGGGFGGMYGGLLGSGLGHVLEVVRWFVGGFSVDF